MHLLHGGGNDLPSRHEVMSLEECLRVASVFVGLGVNKLRITGGEPLVRKDVMWLIERLGAPARTGQSGPDHQRLTNWTVLPRHSGRRASKRINISLDTLRADRFQSITRIGDLNKVLSGIDAARAAVSSGPAEYGHDARRQR